MDGNRTDGEESTVLPPIKTGGEPGSGATLCVLELYVRKRPTYLSVLARWTWSPAMVVSREMWTKKHLCVLYTTATSQARGAGPTPKAVPSIQRYTVNNLVLIPWESVVKGSRDQDYQKIF